jgi:hypothetical protein
MKGDVSARAAPVDETKDSITGVTLLMPVWGYRFVGRFLEFCLPTLLAPNNIPALTGELPCRFVLLSGESDVAQIRSHPTWQNLNEICTAEIQLIDDLITDGNHTATITLAFERAIRQAGEAMRQTCFMFLMSDYIIADGSLLTALTKIREGASGVLVGNFQVTAEDAMPLLRAALDPKSPQLVLQPRELVQWSLNHLHPATVANIVNVGLSHNAHTNRLFWRVDKDTLIGRFYLMHAIAIRPEVSDFIVGSSWDYSFIPELCPSGKIVTVIDSDEYLVVELQPRQYENENLMAGPITAAELAVSLAEWTTARHRMNVEQTLVFHAAEKPLSLPAVTAQSDAFVGEVTKLLVAPPLVHRDHPYWVGSIAINRYRSKRPLGRDEWEFLLADMAAVTKTSRTSLLLTLREKLFGSRPNVTRLDPLWPDYALVKRAMNEALSAKARVLLVAGEPIAFAQWIVREAGDVRTLGFEQLLELSRPAYLPLLNTFERCVMVVNEGRLEKLDEILKRILPLLKKNGQIHILAINNRPFDTAIQFGRTFVREAARILQHSVSSFDVYYVSSNRSRWWLRNRMAALLSKAGTCSRIQLPFILAAALPTTLGVYFASFTGGPSRTPPLGLWSSVFLTLRLSEDTSQILPRFEEDRIVMSAGVRAPRPANTLELHATAPPRPNADGVFGDDPADVARRLARYRFVAKLLGHRHDVAEVGYADPLGTRLVAGEVRQLTVYNVGLEGAAYLQRYLLQERTCVVLAHDVLSSPLPKLHDSIYSLECMQHITPDQQGLFLRHLRASLSREFDFALIGAPTHHAATATGRPQRWRGLLASVSEGPHGESRIYLRSPEELLELMQQHFHGVFMFSMIDDIIHPGLLSDAEFAFALGCGRKP